MMPRETPLGMTDNLMHRSKESLYSSSSTCSFILYGWNWFILYGSKLDMFKLQRVYFQATLQAQEACQEEVTGFQKAQSNRRGEADSRESLWGWP